MGERPKRRDKDGVTMRIRRWLCLTLALMLMMAVLPSGAMAKTKKPSIRLSGKLGLMYVGGSVQLKPTLKNLDKSAVTFSSSDMSVATVSQTGMVQAASAGRTVITVSGGGVSAKCGVVVLPQSVSVEVGQKVNLPNGGLEKYRVRNSKVAAVSKKGIVTGKKAGETQVAVKYGKQTLTVNVSVTAAGAPDAPIGSKAAGLDAASQASQIVLVEYTGGSSARLSVHEKKDGIWTQLMETSAYVGKKGIGKTREGDKKTPTGTYNLTTPFGIKADPGANMPYTQVTEYHYWCGTSKSEYYNQLVDARQTGRSCTKSDEHLIDYKGYYNYCMFIDYNAEGTAGKGSCIFLHCTGGKGYTAGCVAIDEESMKKIVQWAKPGVKIVIQKA